MRPWERCPVAQPNTRDAHVQHCGNGSRARGTRRRGFPRRGPARRRRVARGLAGSPCPAKMKLFEEEFSTRTREQCRLSFNCSLIESYTGSNVVKQAKTQFSGAVGETVEGILSEYNYQHMRKYCSTIEIIGPTWSNYIY